MVRALITGGAGFIGSRLARSLAERGQSVTVFDSLHRQVHGERAAAPEFPGNVIFRRGDVSDQEALARMVGECDPDTIYHLAAETGTGQSYDEPARYCEVNIGGTCNLAEALRRAGDKRRRVVLAGSRAVYGEGAARTRGGELVSAPPRRSADLAAGRYAPVGEDGSELSPCPTPETLVPRPASIYASTKLMQEFVLEQCAEGSDMEVVLLRFQNVYGPGQSLFNSYTGVLSIFARQILDGMTLEIYEDGAITRDFVYVDDVVAALVAAGTTASAPRGPINIGSGDVATILDTARILMRALGASDESFEITGKFRPGDIRYAVADTMRARTLLGWEPRVELATGLANLARWAQEERAAGRI